MTKSLLHPLTGSAHLLLLFAALNAGACGTGSGTITNVSDSAGDTFQITGLSSSGLLTGYLFRNQPHAFLYSNGAVSDLGTLGGSQSAGTAINAAGQIAGGSLLSDSQFHAFLYSGGPLLDLGTLGGDYSNPTFINDAGQVVGNSLTADNDTMGFLYSNGSMASLGTLGGTYSSAFSINNFGVICGESSTPDEDTHGFIYSAGVMTDVGVLGGPYSSCFALNDSGTVVGESWLANGFTHAFSYSAGTITDLGTLGGTYSSASSINQAGQILGLASTANDREFHAFVVTGGAMTDLGTLGGHSSQGAAINNHGQVVGQSAISTGANHAFLWQNGTMIDLNSVLPSNSGWQLLGARFINDSARIVGFGVYRGASQWFIMDLASANHPPVANAGPDQTVDCQASATLNGTASSDPDGDALAFEWSSLGTVLSTNPIFTASFPLGTNTITLKVTDPCGSSAQANVIVKVVDNAPPTGSCPAPVTASSDANCQAAVPNFVSQVVANDTCSSPGSLLITQSPAAGTLVGLGPHPVTVTVTDASGNSANCAVLFTVVDTMPPTIFSTPAPIALSVAANCQVAVPSVISNILATDNCTPANQLLVTQNPAAGTLVGVGQYTITVTVSDASGNSSMTGVALKVTDTTAPTFLATPGPITVSVTANCQAAVPDVVGQILVTDNCTPANQLVITQSPAAGTMLPVGQYVVTVTATDASGNSASAALSLTIADTTPPVVQALTVSPNVLSPPNHELVCVTVTPVVSDNCDTTPVTKIIKITCTEPTAPGDIQITGNLTATLAASKNSSGSARVYTLIIQTTDASGNGSSASVMVTVPKSNGNGAGTTVDSYGKHLK